jgi:phosphate-selective porin OprO and OprP
VRLRNRLLPSAFGCSMLLAAYPAVAQTNDQLQQQIQQLQRQLQQLQNQVDEQARRTPPPAAPTAAAPPASGVKVTLSPNNRPGISSADGQNTIELTSRVHFDIADYLSVHPQTPGGPHSLTSGVNARRARLGVLGKFLGDWNYAFVLDFGGSSDSNNNGVTGSRTSDIEIASLSYTGFRPFAIELGYMDVPWTLDEATSSNDIMFLERASPGVVAASLAAGDFRSAGGVRWNTDRAWAGAYVTGPTSGANHSGGDQQQVGGVARATYQMLQSNFYSLHLGVDGEYVFQPKNNGSGTGAITNGVSFSDRPELRVDPTVFINTGTIPAKNAAVYGAEAAGGFGSFFAQGEYYIYQVKQAGFTATAPKPELTFDGGYAEASYVITGEARKYIPTSGAYSGVRPDRPVGSGGWGAWEVAARYSYLNLNNHATPGVAATTTGGVFGGRQNIYTVGLNWYPIYNIRFMLDYIYADVNKIPTATAVGGSTTPGAVIQAIATRVQVAF